MRRPLALALALVAALACSREPSSAQREAWAAEIERLSTEAETLQQRLRALTDADPRRAALPEGDVVIAVPTGFLEELIRRVFSDVASHVTLTLQGIRAHVAKPLKKKITLGEFVLDLHVNHVVGRLHPGEPELRFGGDRVSMTLPITVVEGTGDATAHFRWKGRGVAGAVCGDLDVTENVSGSVKSARYAVSGTLSLGADGAEVLGTPHFPETKVRLRVVPSEASWRAIDAILETKRGVCGWVLDHVDVRKLLTHEVEEKGFHVKLPLDKVKPFRFPAGLSESVELGGRTLGLDVRTGTLRIDPDAVWIAARVAVKPEAPPGVASAP